MRDKILLSYRQKGLNPEIWEEEDEPKKKNREQGIKAHREF